MTKKRNVLLVAGSIFFLIFAAGFPLVSAAPAADDDQGATRQDKRIVAVLFSVGQTDDAHAQFPWVQNLDLLEVGGKPMIKHVYDAVKGSKYINKIVVVAAPEVEEVLDLKDNPIASFVVDQGDAARNVQFGVDEVQRGDLIMFIPSDLVLVTTEDLDQLIEYVRNEKGVDAIFPLVSREECERQYPQEARTYGRFKEGQFTGAHVEFVRPDLFLDHSDQVEAQKDNLYNLYYMRKSTLGAVRFLGVKLTIKYIFGTLSVHDIEEHVYEKYRVNAKAVYWNNADLATDLSEPKDIQMVNRTLQQRAAAQTHVPPESPTMRSQS